MPKKPATPRKPSPNPAMPDQPVTPPETAAATTVRESAVRSGTFREKSAGLAALRKTLRAFAAIPVVLSTAAFAVPQEAIPPGGIALTVPAVLSGADPFPDAAPVPAVPAAVAASAASPSSGKTGDAPAELSAGRHAAVPSEQHRELQKQLMVWIDALAKQEAFRHWAGAEIRLDPLGPGTHGWLATLTDPDAGEPVGYLVVYAEDGPEGGYRLGEYGLGASPLFAEPVALRSLRENGLLPPSGEYAMTRVYRHPLAAAWKVRVDGSLHWLDAKTGEELPLDERAWARAAPPAQIPSPAPGETVAAVLLGEPFDPYERLPWLTGEAPLSAEPPQTILERLRKGLPVRFVAEPFGDPVLYALPVVGYVAWSGGRIDLAFDQFGFRFVPLPLLRELGKFYQ